jgi:UDP-2,3-diacylglucosamine pyrophosphatase LpxH
MVEGFGGRKKIRAGTVVIRTAVILCGLVILFSGCNVDIFGIFGSGDLAERFKDRNSFHFLSDAERRPNFHAPYSFIVITDTHIEKGDARGLEKIKGAVQASGAVFAVITGDITQNGRKEDVEKFIEIANSLRSLSPAVPLYPVLGNHDIYFNNWRVWRDLIGSASYRIESPDTTLIMLDSANANFGMEQLGWLEDQLKSAKPQVFIFTHANLFSQNISDIEMLTDIRERAKAISLLKDRCDAVFAGHVHRRIIREAGGVRYITLEDFRDNSTYCLVRVEAGGNISWEFETL